MKKVVIVGGGFVGSYCAKALENDFDTILIDTTDYFEFTPSVLRVIVEPKCLKNIHVKHKDYLKKANFIHGEVKEVNKKYVLVKGKKIKFDYLVICSGSKYYLPIKEQNVLVPTRIENLKKSNEELKKAKNVVLIGGGIVGVELAAEIIEKFPKKKVTIIEGQDCLVKRNNAKCGIYAENFLEKRGVKVLLNELFVKEIKNYVITNKGKRIKADLIFICTGINFNSEFMQKNFSRELDNKKRIKVNEFLQLHGSKNIFVGGDILAIDEEKLAQNARKHSKIISGNIMRIEKGKKLKKYVSKKRPFVISLGKYHGIFEYGDFVMDGFIPALMKKIIEIWEVGRFRWL